MPESFLHLKHQEQSQIYRALAPRLARSPVVLEKDVWVCWVLQILFTIPTDCRWLSKAIPRSPRCSEPSRASSSAGGALCAAGPAHRCGASICRSPARSRHSGAPAPPARVAWCGPVCAAISMRTPPDPSPFHPPPAPGTPHGPAAGAETGLHDDPGCDSHHSLHDPNRARLGVNGCLFGMLDAHLISRSVNIRLNHALRACDIPDREI
jgi:hypothetical protein